MYYTEKRWYTEHSVIFTETSDSSHELWDALLLIQTIQLIFHSQQLKPLREKNANSYHFKILLANWNLLQSDINP